MSFRWPLNNFTISQGFGGNADYYRQYGQQGHNGIDLAAPAGTPVLAADDGVVAFEGWGKTGAKGFAGWMGDPAGISMLINNTGSYSGYAHMTSTVVSAGDHVTKGQVIGYVGSTGAATGPHLHFEMLPLSPNFSNGFAGRINPMPFIETVQNATDDQIRQAYLNILERAADGGALAHYRPYTNDFVRQDLANSQEKRDLDARKAQAAQDAANLAAAQAAQAVAEAKKNADKKAADEAAQKAADQLALANAEAARVAEEERVARLAAEAKAQSQKDIQTSQGGDMSTKPEQVDKVNPVTLPVVTTPTDASKSATLFITRIATQVTAARLVAEGLSAIIYQQVAFQVDQFWIGVITLVLAALIIFWGQFGYQLAKLPAFAWASNLKWPF